MSCIAGRLFCYGTLRFPAIMQAVIGRVPGNRSVTLYGYACYSVRGKPYPALVPKVGAEVSGVVYEGLAMDDFSRLDDYEGPEYSRRRIEVEVYRGEPVSVWCYLWRWQYRSRLNEREWDIDAFERRHLSDYIAVLSGSGGRG